MFAAPLALLYLRLYLDGNPPDMVVPDAVRQLPCMQVSAALPAVFHVLRSTRPAMAAQQQPMLLLLCCCRSCTG
jgi:hypothetical protein